MYKLIILFFITVASCGAPKNTSETSSNNETEVTTQVQEETTTLALGETKQVGDIQIKFKEVLEDSRCPTGVQCMWQGRAKILVETSKDGVMAENLKMARLRTIPFTKVAIQPSPLRL